MNDHHLHYGKSRSPDQIEADRLFLAKMRKLSPQFPDIATSLLRRQQAREALAVRILLALAVIFGVASPFADHPGFMALAAGAFLLGFVITCFVAGNRSHNRAGGSSGRPGA